MTTVPTDCRPRFVHRSVWRGRVPLLVLLCGCAFMATFVSTPALSAQERPWAVEDVMGLRGVGDVAISPAGDWIAYVVDHRDLDHNDSRSDVWLAPAEGGTPISLTRGGADNRGPTWAPDGSWLGFLSDRSGSTQVFGIRPTGGEAWQVTDVKGGVSGFVLAPSGERIAYTASPAQSEEDEERERWRGLPMVWDSAYATDWTYGWTADLRNGVAADAERATPDGLSVRSVVWSPDSRGLAWSAVAVADERTFDSRDRPTGLALDADVFVQEVPGGPARQVTSMDGSASVVDWVEGVGLVVSASGSEVGTDNRLLWAVDPSGNGEPRPLTEAIDEHAGLVSITPSELLVEARHGTGSRLYRVTLRDGQVAGGPEPVTDDRQFYSGFSATADGEAVAFTANGPSASPNVHVSSTAAFAPRQLTDVNPQTSSLSYGEQRVVRWPSDHDGEEIEGVLTLPVGYQEGDRVPLLLVIHGGPAGNSANTFAPGGRYPIQVFAGRGYASLQPNYRGSTGYGERFRGLNRGHISGHDWIDVNSGVDHLIDAGIADPERLGIMGWSFGGHHTYWGITQTDRFKAASAGAGANDLISMYSQTDRPAFYHTYLGPKPWEDFDLYEERSAFRFADRVTTPLLIQVGERDERVPAEQSIQFYEAVKAIGKAPTTLVIYPGEGHGIQDVAFTRDVMERNVEWFERWIPVGGSISDSSGSGPS